MSDIVNAIGLLADRVKSNTHLIGELLEISKAVREENSLLKLMLESRIERLEVKIAELEAP